MTITYTTTMYNKINNKWVEESPTKSEVVNETFVKNFLEAAPFMRHLGGSESIRRDYTGRIKNISTSPDKQSKRISFFSYSYD